MKSLVLSSQASDMGIHLDADLASRSASFSELLRAAPNKDLMSVEKLTPSLCIIKQPGCYMCSSTYYDTGHLYGQMKSNLLVTALIYVRTWRVRAELKAKVSILDWSEPRLVFLIFIY